VKEQGFSCETIYDKYNPKGIRYWTIMVDGGNKDILITCVKKNPTDFHFLINLDSINNYQFNTSSMDVIVQLIRNIVHEPEMKQEIE
jgi:hypothetical protein